MTESGWDEEESGVRSQEPGARGARRKGGTGITHWTTVATMCRRTQGSEASNQATGETG